jgi:DNA-binding NarL/FixJ family response regulator
VLLLDDHPVVTEGLRLLLDRQPDVEVVATAASLEQVVTTDQVPDVIVADLVLGQSRGADVVVTLKERFPHARVLVLTMVDDPLEVKNVLAAGAHGYMVKEAAAADLVDAVRRVAAGEDFLQPSVGAALIKAGREGTPHGPLVQLTERETQVARLLVLGHTNAEIADVLVISQRTVETHRARLLEKLGVRTRAELVQKVITVGLIDLSAR